MNGAPRLSPASIAWLVAALLGGLAETSWGCTCSPRRTQGYEDRASVIFIGRVIHVQGRLQRESRAVFADVRVLKGRVEGPLLAKTDGQPHGCGTLFEEDVYYVVFADEKWTTSGCDGTVPIGPSEAARTERAYRERKGAAQ